MRVALKYCGSCNPRIDLSSLGRLLRGTAPATVEFVSMAASKVDAVVVFDGCPVACADRAQIRGLGARAIVVAESVAEWERLPEAELAERVLRLLGVDEEPG